MPMSTGVPSGCGGGRTSRPWLPFRKKLRSSPSVALVVVLRAIGSWAPHPNEFCTLVQAPFPDAPMVSPKVTISSPLCSKAMGTSSPNTSALATVWLVVGLQVGALLVIVASHSAQSQSPLTWYSLTEDPGM